MNGSLLDRPVAYTLEIDGQLHVVENVPARVNLKTGEQLFAPATVEQLQRLIWEHKQVSLREFVQFVEFAASSAATA